MAAVSGDYKSPDGPVGVWAILKKSAVPQLGNYPPKPAVYIGNDEKVFKEMIVQEMFRGTNFDRDRYAKSYQNTADGIWKRLVYAPPKAVSDETKQARIEELEKEIAALRLSASEEASKKPDGQPSGIQSGGSLPPPSTYAEAVRREFNRAKHAEARADKLNRAKMAAVAEAAAVVRQQEKERALREKFKEGYVPLDVRKNKQRIASEAKAKKKPTSVVQKAALVAHTFVRFTRAQMREHQLQVLKMTGADRWFSAAERAAYKALSPARKAEIKADRMRQSELIEAKKAAEREQFRKERAIRVATMSKARVEAIARSNPKQVYKGKGRVKKACPGGCRFVVNPSGTGTSCRDCGVTGVTD